MEEAGRSLSLSLSLQQEEEEEASSLSLLGMKKMINLSHLSLPSISLQSGVTSLYSEIAPSGYGTRA